MIITYNELISEKSSLDLGGKINGIRWLLQNNFLIPKGCVIPSSDIHKTHYESIKKTDMRLPIILRSSANCEDSLLASYAGMFESKIIESWDDYNIAIEGIYNSIHSSESKLYALHNNQKVTEVHILLQEYIMGTVSGVYFSDLFGKGPLIEYVEGPCSLLVNSTVNAQKVWENDKKEILQFNEILTGIFYTGKKIKNLYNINVDIEWTLHKNNLYLLQIRPICKTGN